MPFTRVASWSIGISQNYLSTMERGKVEIGAEILLRISVEKGGHYIPVFDGILRLECRKLFRYRASPTNTFRPSKIMKCEFVSEYAVI
jgi:hypothetical protein